MKLSNDVFNSMSKVMIPTPAGEVNVKEITDKISDVQQEPFPNLGTTTNVGNNYTVTTDIVIPNDPNKKFSVNFNVSATGASTLKLTSDNVIRNLIKQGGASFVPKSGIYSFVRIGENFQLLGEGGDIPKLPNLLKNGNYENNLNLWYTPSPGATLSINTSYKKFGTSSANLFVPSTLSEGFIMQDGINYIQGHKYYISYWFLSSLAERTSSVYFPATGSYPVSQLVVATNPYTWYFNSFISSDSSIISGNYSIRFDCDNYNTDTSMAFDGGMIIDLTECFGAGKEPTKSDIDYMVNLNGGWWDCNLQILTSDATALATDIISGKTAYINGWNITGTYTTKRTLTFNATSSADTYSFSSRSGIITKPYIYYSGLPFTPSIIMFCSVDGDLQSFVNLNMPLFLGSHWIQLNVSGAIVQIDSLAFISGGSFRLPVDSANIDFTIIAIE